MLTLYYWTLETGMIDDSYYAPRFTSDLVVWPASAMGFVPCTLKCISIFVATMFLHTALLL